MHIFSLSTGNNSKYRVKQHPLRSKCIEYSTSSS